MVQWFAQRLVKSLAVSLLLLMVSGCSKGEQMQIRIRNNSNQDIKNFWLGAGGTGPTPLAYGPIPAGSTTDYKAIEPIFARYHQSDFLTTDGTRYLTTIYPEKYLNVSELAPGAYTFAYDIQNGEAVLDLITD